MARELYGVMAARGAASGIVVTSGKFTQDAVEFASGAERQADRGRRAAGAREDEPENLLCASEIANSVRNANPTSPLYFFRSGGPNASFFDYCLYVPVALQPFLKRQRTFVPSDRFFNQALCHISWRLQRRHTRSKRIDGNPFERSDGSWLQLAHKYLVKWARRPGGRERGAKAQKIARHAELRKTQPCRVPSRL